MLVLILLSFSASMLLLLLRNMVRFEIETNDGKMISSSYRLSKQTIFHVWIFFKAMTGSVKEAVELLRSEMSTWDERRRAVRIGKSHYVFISSPDDIQIVFNNSHMMEKSNLDIVLRNVVGNAIVAAPFSIWKNHRRHIAPAFTSSRSIESYFKNFNKQADDLIRILEKTYETGKTIDLFVPITRTTFRMVLGSIVGDSSPVTDEEEDKLLKSVAHFERLIRTVLPRPWLHSRKMFKLYVRLMGYQKYFDFTAKLTDKMVSEKMRMNGEKISDDAYEEGNITVLDELLRKVDKGQFSYQDVLDEILGLVAGGGDPTSLAVCFTFLLLAGNPEIQEKAYAEISSIIGDDDKPIDTAMVKEMKYLEMCFKESLRMFSATQFIGRRATADVKLSPTFTIKRGTEVVTPLVLVHRNPKFYENPHVWNPDNFTEEKEQSRHKFAFIPFGRGPRGCIGNNYVMMSGRVILAKVLRKYRLTTDVKPEDVRIVMNFLLRSKNGFPVRLHRRSR